VQRETLSPVALEVSAVESWHAALRHGDLDAAWDLFLDRYRRLVFATIRHFTRDEDEILDVFACVCEALRAADMARLRRYREDLTDGASFSTWLVAVVRNQAIDWLRRRDGRRRPSVPATLSPLQQQIYQHVFLDGRSHVEAYELVRMRPGCELPFGAFLKEVSATYRAAGRSRRAVPMREQPAPSRSSWAEEELRADDLASAAEARERIADALNSLEPEERLAVQLFVVDDEPAAEVARTVGWPNAKTVYNRVYRCLASIRLALERQGIRSGDL
jgi:RNA polymerase sigma factor (sigma-70 family)